MRYMFLVMSPERAGPPPQRLMEEVGKLAQREMAAGALVDQGGLMPLAMGARVRVSDGKLTVMDGPFAETKEVIGGYAIFELPNREEALERAKASWSCIASTGAAGKACARCADGADGTAAGLTAHFLQRGADQFRRGRVRVKLLCRRRHRARRAGGIDAEIDQSRHRFRARASSAAAPRAAQMRSPPSRTLWARLARQLLHEARGELWANAIGARDRGFVLQRDRVDQLLWRSTSRMASATFAPTPGMVCKCANHRARLRW